MSAATTSGTPKPGRKGRPAIELTADEYQELCDAYGGVCLACGEHAYGDTEPDAEGYKCDSCGAMAVEGIENALIGGHITIADE